MKYKHGCIFFFDDVNNNSADMQTALAGGKEPDVGAAQGLRGDKRAARLLCTC